MVDCKVYVIKPNINDSFLYDLLKNCGYFLTENYTIVYLKYREDPCEFPKEEFICVNP